MRIVCTCGQIFKDELFASAESQFRAHTAILAPYGKLTSEEHKPVVKKERRKKKC